MTLVVVGHHVQNTASSKLVELCPAIQEFAVLFFSDRSVEDLYPSQYVPLKVGPLRIVFWGA
jgi:hypothetical protein